MTTSGHSAEAPAALKIEFDFDNGNFIRDLITTNGGGGFPPAEAIAPGDTSIYTWITYLFQVSWFDALAPYHPTAVGVYSRIDRRPAAESATNRNKNIAGLHASYQVVKVAFAERAPVMRMAMAAIGLNPDDESEDPTTPVGIGNLAGKAVVAARLHDGMNHLGDKGRVYNGRPYADYTGYAPVNTAYELRDPSRWQPALGPHQRRVGGGPGDKGIFTVQQFATPQLRLVKPVTFKDPSEFELAPPDHLDHTDAETYKRSVDDVLKASAALTDEQKVKAEFFEHSPVSLTWAPRAAALAHDLDLDGWAQLFITTSLARFDNLIAVWHHKHAHDAVRPFSAVRHVYGSTPVTAWGGPGKGTVTDIPADEWSSYLPAGNHPEYPSAFTTLCSAQAQAARRVLGDDVLDWTHAFPAGSAQTEPGLVPAGDLKLSWETWTDFVGDCAQSRVWAGVAFRETVERSVVFGARFGDLAHEFIQRHVNGDVGD
ncbi:DUF6851 domain-containing protein [Streptomyces sp. DH24]|uniref:DUF6851 domain-containing protein n=1 Tax=Streptomyces sp. DH24 TaxID=3040123 RepID=UPI0024417DAC|nr:hypothetical protein [Streptomyces sp. DH24]MDG9720192.1 hypothetical protein [Streptomyces sp. DH24]